MCLHYGQTLCSTKVWTQPLLSFLPFCYNTPMTNTIVDSALIQQTELFSSLSSDELSFIISHSGVLNLSGGEPLFASGEKARQFFILKSGSIRVYKTRDDGGEDEMAMFTAGDTIGDFDFARGAEYDASAAAAEDSELVVFPDSGHTMDSLSAKDPRIVCNILFNAIILITGRIKSANKVLLENMSWVQEIHRRAYEDAGTGLWKQTLINDEIIKVLKDPSALIMLKPDRFKILVDSRGHSAGDEAMIKIALILKNLTRQKGNAWALRFKSNEVGVIINNCDADSAERTAKELHESIAAMEPAPALNDIPEFSFSATISWAVWQADNPEWDSLFKGNYTSLMDNWKDGGDRIIRYNGT